MKTLIDVAVPSITFILLAAVGMDLTGEDFTRVRRRRLVVAAGLFAPLLLLPPLAVSLTVLFRPDSDTAAGVLLIASCPIGGISNSYSYLARASTALSVTLTGFSCLLAAVTVPLVGQGLELALGRPLDLEAPISLLLAQLLLMLAAPVTLGMWIRRRWPGFADEHRMGLQRLAFAAIAGVLTLVILDNVGAFVEGLWSTVPLAASFVLCSMAVGWLTGMTVTSDPRDRFTLAAEFGTRNVAVAAAIAVTLLGRVEFARFATIYFLTELPLMLAAIAWFRANRG
ncbi:MAG TPA: bile acid:sodium symporter [Vicinamibacterales bacterium]|nr:bile acid:sodium symporter [Vicinamibacterales bacterium]